jgi:hypothetical protein
VTARGTRLAVTAQVTAGSTVTCRTSSMGVTSRVVRTIDTACLMETFDFNYTVAVIVAVLVSLGRIVTLLFATLRVCVQEYYEFKVWLRALRGSRADPG